MATKITYATLGGDTLEELHRELDAAIAAAPHTFDREHLLFIDGKHFRSDTQFEDRSPIDTGIVLGRFQKGTREHVRPLFAAARGVPGVGLAAMAAETCLRCAESPMPSAPSVAAVGADGIRSRQESARMRRRRRRSRGSHLPTTAIRSSSTAGSSKNGITRPRRRKRQRAAALWRVGCHLAVQFSACPRRGTGWRGARRRAIRWSSSPRAIRRSSGAKLGRDGDRSGTARRRLQLRHRARLDGGPGPDRQRRHRRDRLHGIERGRAQADARQRRAPVPRPFIIEMGGKNPALVARRRSRQGIDGVMRFRFRRPGAEMFRLLARIHPERRARAFVRSPGAENRAHRMGNPLERDVWMGPVINEGAVETYLSAVERAKRDGGQDSHRRKAHHRTSVRPRLFRRADHHRRAPARSSALLGGAVRAHHGDGAGDDARRSAQLANRTEYGLTAGIYSERRRGSENLLRAHPGGGHLRKSPRRSDHWRLARRSTPSADGRPAARPAEGPVAPTTCNNSCANKAGSGFAASNFLDRRSCESANPGCSCGRNPSHRRRSGANPFPRRSLRRRSAAQCQVRLARKHRHATIPRRQPARAESAAGSSQPTRLRPCGARKYVSRRSKFASTTP